MNRSIPIPPLVALLLAVPAMSALSPAAARALPRVSTTDSSVPASQMPGPLKQVGYDQRLGQKVPLDLAFRDETGRPVRLGAYLGDRPAILVLAYYECPMLCSMVLAGVAGSLKPLSLDVGEDFDVVVVSIDPGETPQLAAGRKREVVGRYGRYGTEEGWHFLTGGQDAITRLARAVGFRYYYDAERDEYAHAAGMVVLTPGGEISRYLFGIEYAPRDVRLALVESAGGRIGTLVDQVLLYCYHYDPQIGRYSAAAMNVLRLAAAATVAGLVLMIVLLRRRERRQAGAVGAVSR